MFRPYSHITPYDGFKQHLNNTKIAYFPNESTIIYRIEEYLVDPAFPTVVYLSQYMPISYRTQVFVSYSHKDAAWLDKLREHFAPDIRNGRLDYWDDRRIETGDRWRIEIDEAVRHARVALLLISPNFLASDFIMREELPRIIEAAKDGLTVVWIPLSGTFDGPLAPPELRPITDIQAAAATATPLEKLQEPSLNATLLDVCRQVHKLINPGRIPWNLPFSSLAELFKGREETLAEIDRELRKHGSAALLQPHIIHGLCGIGKTRLAIEYAWRHQNDFTACLFVSANRPEDLDSNLASLCRPGDCLDLPEYRSINQDEQRDAVIRWLQQNKGWLLIIDNVDTDESVRAVKSLVAKLRGGHVLITSRVTEWGRGVRPLPLDVLSTENAVALLVESTAAWRMPKEGDKLQARTLAERLGNLPLALTHATAYMQHHHMGFAAYLDDFERHFERLLAYHDHTAIEYETELDKDDRGPSTPEAKAARKALIKTVATTFFLSFDRLSPEAKAILRGSAFLAPDPIPIAMFEACPNETLALVTLWCEGSGETRTGQTVPDALAELGRYSLISRGDGFFSIHRMEQRIMRNHMSSELLPLWHGRVQALVSKYAPEETSESPRTWAVWDVLRPHAEFLIGSFVSDDKLPSNPALMTSIGTLLFGKGLHVLSLAMEESTLNVISRSPGFEGTTDTANKHINRGESLRALKRPKEALEAFRRAFEIFESSDGKDTPNAASALNYLGLAHSDLGEKNEAENCYRRAIAIYESHHATVRRSDFAKPLNNLSILVTSAGDLVEGEKLLRKAVELSTEDGKHTVKPQLAIICRTQLAELLTKKGDLNGAERYFEDAIKRLSVFPDEHPFKETVLERFSEFLLSVHKLTEAKRQYAKLTLVNRPQWGTDELKKQPERRLRRKLRILEARAKFSDTHPAVLSSPTHAREISDELTAKDPEPWHPPMITGVSIQDSDKLNWNFIIDTGSDKDWSGNRQKDTRSLVDIFLAAISVNEEDQWAASDSEMPPQLRGSKLGSMLAEQGQVLSEFVSAALSGDNPAGKAFRSDVNPAATFAGTDPHEFPIDIFISPACAQVYTGTPEGRLSDLITPGENHASVTKAPLDVFWEWHLPRTHRIAPEGSIDRLNNAFQKHIVPTIQRSLTGSRLFGPLRQIIYCMTLATWFKQEYRFHPDLAKYLETGDPSQLNSTILGISDSADVPGDIKMSTTEASWGRAVALNNEALSARKIGRLDEAERLLREALSHDESSREPSDPKIAHRMNNLSIVLVMKEGYAEARELLSRAWTIKLASGHDITSQRILFVRSAAALLQNEPMEPYIGRIRALRQGDPPGDKANITQFWDIGDFLDHLRPRISARDLNFVTLLYKALNNREDTPELDQLTIWKDQPSLPVDIPWS
ncbi:MAG: tetratricopeptide repeat protein [Candidatus Omnitrophica bacterium]|nr:tetratricopeptide repeat protein [Candidatus Omnitrophota bacterium]